MSRGVRIIFVVILIVIVVRFLGGEPVYYGSEQGEDEDWKAACGVAGITRAREAGEGVQDGSSGRNGEREKVWIKVGGVLRRDVGPEGFEEPLAVGCPAPDGGRVNRSQ